MSTRSRLCSSLTAFCFATSIGASAAAQSAQDDEPAEQTRKLESAEERERERNAGHAGQLGLRAAFVGGFRMVFRYDESPYCAEPDLTKKNPNDQKKFCGHLAPFATDLALSYALADFLEPYLWARLGFTKEKQTDTNPLVLLGVGTRIYTVSDGAVKVFIEPAVGWELEGGAGRPEYQLNDPEYKRDLVFHLAAGPQFDVHENFGFYLHAGLTTGILRAIHTNMEAALGLQGRFP